MNSKSPFFTVFIGLYNSEKVIHRFFESCKSQTFRDFELIIVDDCSQDNTVKITEDFINSAKDVHTTFVKNKPNKGIAYSRKKALSMAKGEVFVKWDHDDIQDPNQLKDFYEAYHKYKDKNIASVWCLCKDMQDNVVGNKYSKDFTIGTYFSMYTKYILSTINAPRERHNCISVKVHKDIYDYIENNKLLPEGFTASATDIWSVLAILGHKTIYINKPLRQYFIENDRPRMSNSGRKQNADRVYIDRLNWINYYMKHLPFSDIIWRIRLFLSVNQYGYMADKTLKNTLNQIHSTKNKFLSILFYLPVKAFVLLSGRNK
jgi:glycosyltransferase involved in cell wall biosynthesis